VLNADLTKLKQTIITGW